MAADIKDRSAHAALRRLRDEIIDLYLDWARETVGVADAYGSWPAARAGEERAGALRRAAALDREEAAARRYPDVLAHV